MLRAVNLIFFSVMIVVAVVTYDMKHDAEVAADTVARLHADLEQEKSQIAMLRAELSLLTQPSRLQSVVDTYADYFRLQPFRPDQIGTIDEIPVRPDGPSALDALLATASVLPSNVPSVSP
jgi:hypothetical protein